jgi:hypothetical protein
MADREESSDRDGIAVRGGYGGMEGWRDVSVGHGD